MWPKHWRYEIVKQIRPHHSANRSSLGSPLLIDRGKASSGWMSSFAVFSCALMLLCVALWASVVEFDQITRTAGQVVASNRVQVVQSVDGGVLERLHVREGDRVEQGQLLATLETARSRAAVRESEARVVALRATIIRLDAELNGASSLQFPQTLKARHPEVLNAQGSLFAQRREALATELATLETSARLARQEFSLVDGLYRTGDVSQSEWLRSNRAALEAEAQVVIRKQRWMQEAGAERARAEEELAQVEQVRAQRLEMLGSLELRAPVRGVVRNVRLTTKGAVLRAGEEFLSIVPVDDRLVVEAKVSPADIARLRPGLPVSIKFDAWEYTTFGTVPGRLVYISADALRDENRAGDFSFYRVHVETDALSGAAVPTSLGRKIEVISGMTASLDIRTGKQSALDYLLKPFRRVLDEAFTES